MGLRNRIRNGAIVACLFQGFIVPLIVAVSMIEQLDVAHTLLLWGLPTYAIWFFGFLVFEGD